MEPDQRSADSVFTSSLDEARTAASDGDASQQAGRWHGVDAELESALDDIVADYLATAEPGLELMRLLGWLRTQHLGPTSLLAWLRAHARCASWWSAQDAGMIVAFAGSEPQTASFDVRGLQVVLEDVAREELAVALRWTGNFAQRRIDEARLLSTALPNTLSALESGAISPAHSRVMVESAQRLAVTTPPGTAAFHVACAELEKRVLGVACREGLGRTRSAANRAIALVDPAGRQDRRTNALRGRGVWLRDEPDGVATLIAKLSAEHAHACYAAVEQLAAAGAVDGLPFCDESDAMGVRRSLALVHLTLGTGRDEFRSEDLSESPAMRPRIRTHIDVVVDLPTLLGLQDNDGEIVGGGELAAQAIRDLVASDKTATLRRLVTDPQTGHLLDIGRKRYAVPDALREFIVMRDQRCRFPGCNARAATAEVDHALPWEGGGSTNRANLGALCKRHHQVKSLGGWEISSSDENGGCTWMSPTGNVYVHEPVSLAQSRVPLADGNVGEAGDLIHHDP